MDRIFDRRKNAPPHRWLGLRPIDFVRAAERRAAVLLRQLGERPRGAEVTYRLPIGSHPLSRRRLSVP
jgi:hypothetical protein